MRITNHVLVGGPGRSGSTALMTLLTLIDSNLTGFTDTDLIYVKNSKANAGLEVSIEKICVGINLPYVIKNPALHSCITTLINEKKIEIGHIIIPIRDIDAVRASRINVSKKYLDSLSIILKCKEIIKYFYQIFIKKEPDYSLGEGGVNFNYFQNESKTNLEQIYNIYKLCDVGASNMIPITFLSFPRFIKDKNYCYSTLSRIFDLDEELFGNAFSRLGLYKK